MSTAEHLQDTELTRYAMAATAFWTTLLFLASLGLIRYGELLLDVFQP